MIRQLTRRYLQAVVWLNRKSKSAAVRLTRMTGKSRVSIHPKHLLPTGENHAWYLDHIRPGMRVLDVGCGNGVHSLRAADQGATVIGVDYGLGHLQVACMLASSKDGRRAAFFLGNLEQALPVAKGQFELVMLLDVIEHLYRRIELLREIHATMQAGSLLVVAAPNRETSWKRRLRTAGLPYYTDPDHKWEYTWDDLREELCAGGFETVGAPAPIVYDTPWAGFIDVVGGLSLPLYRRLMAWKVEMAQRHPQETIGWKVVCRRIGD
jgi:2-polyprenyl-3-methyl-5-hydroxy-6-metoxy-1,4-benzoquinol methylase